MFLPTDTRRIGLLLSGGLDSCILLGELVEQGYQVLPVYVESGLVWEEAELRSVKAFLRTLRSDAVEPLVVLEMPLADVYGRHWSITGTGVPKADSPDDAVYLPARNALLLIKAGLCCLSRNIENLAIGILGTSPFTDAGRDFFDHFAKAMNASLTGRIQLHRPFANASKQEVMGLGRGLPLERTFSCLSPQQQLHCGECNKCAERRLAFQEAGIEDRTEYAVAYPATG